MKSISYFKTTCLDENIWSRSKAFPGIYASNYKGHCLRIEPVGMKGWDGTIDGKFTISSNDAKIIEERLLSIVDFWAA